MTLHDRYIQERDARASALSKKKGRRLTFQESMNAMLLPGTHAFIGLEDELNEKEKQGNSKTTPTKKKS